MSCGGSKFGNKVRAVVTPFRLHVVVLSIWADGQPRPPNPSQVPDVVEPQQAPGDGVTILAEEKGDAPTKAVESGERGLPDGENGGSNMDGTDHGDGSQIQLPLRSSLKRRCSGAENCPKGRVKWMDILGKDLAEVKEFECSDSEDQNGENSIIHSCGCVIQ